MEAATYVYAINKDDRILRDLDRIIDVIGKAQCEDGYLHTKLSPSTDARLTNGATTLTGKVLLRADQTDKMYVPLAEPKWNKQTVQFVPYYNWSNRGTAEMSVWLPLIWK